MPSPRFWLLLASTSAAAGCATITGLDQYEKGDAEVSADAPFDQTVNDVAAETTTNDASNDATGSDATPDVVSDVVATDAQDGSVGDASDAGAGDCGALNTVNDCTMCGDKCDGTNSTNTQCTGATCTYVCKPSFSNCNNAAPDLNGCECATPSCCGASCATTHMNGVGENYYDCVDAGTYNQGQALKACTAYTSDQFACNQASCISDAGDVMVCGYPDGGGCVCWTYTGLDTSHVYKSGTTSCFCPDTNDPTWN